MKKKEVPMFVLRLGSDNPVKGDYLAVGKIREDMNVMGCSANVGVLNLLMTDRSAEEIRDLFKESADELGDVLPVVVWRADQPEFCAVDIDLPHVVEMIQSFEEANGVAILKGSKPTCSLTMDELLDKISRTGYNSLTTEEVARLKSLS
jgi:hypothetical protein